MNRELCNWDDFGLSVGDDKKLFFRKGDNMECLVSSSKLLEDTQNSNDSNDFGFGLSVSFMKLVIFS